MRDEELREAIEAALRPHRHDSVGSICACGTECGVVCDNLTREQHAADALLPVVRRYADQRAAEELRAAADEMDTWTPDEPDARATVAEVIEELASRANVLTREATTDRDDEASVSDDGVHFGDYR